MEVRFKRGTTAQNDAYTGSLASLSLDTDLMQLRIHDGVTPGGHVVPNDSSISDLQEALNNLGISDISGLESALAAKVAIADLGVADGVATLDSSGRVPASQLPSYVDDVLEFDVASGAVGEETEFPATGETGKIYIALDTNKVYRWSGSAYIEIAASPGTTDSVAEGSTNLYFTVARARTAISVSGDLSYDSETGVISFSESVNSVNGQTGEVVLTKSDVGLGNVENYAMATQQEAEAAAIGSAYMSPLATRQLLEHMG